MDITVVYSTTVQLDYFILFSYIQYTCQYRKKRRDKNARPKYLLLLLLYYNYIIIILFYSHRANTTTNTTSNSFLLTINMTLDYGLEIKLN